jgi:hypothetical protein
VLALWCGNDESKYLQTRIRPTLRKSYAKSARARSRRRRSECRRMKSSRYFEACSKHVPNSLLGVSAGLRT